MILSRLFYKKMKAAKEAKALEQLEEPLVSVETPEIGSKTQLRSNTRDFEYQDVKNQPVALTESPAAEVALDLIRRGVIVMPIAVVASLLVGGPTAAAAVAIGMAIILGNFWVSAKILAWASTVSHGMVASTSISGYFIRSFLIAGLVWLLKDVSSVNLLWLVFSLVISHLGLLTWELRYVSTTIAHPGLKPSALGYKPAAGYKREGVA